MALEKGLFCLLLRVGVARLPRPGPGSARLLTLVLLPCRLQPGVLPNVRAGAGLTYEMSGEFMVWCFFSTVDGVTESGLYSLFI